MRRFAGRCTAIVYPDESVIATVADSVADKLGVPPEHVIPAVLGKRIINEYTFTTEDEEKLRRVLSPTGKARCCFWTTRCIQAVSLPAW